MRGLLSREVLTFGAVSVGTTLMDFAVFNLLISATSLSPVMSNTISYSAGVVASYLLNKSLTFRNRGRDNRGHEMGLFLIINVVGLAFNNGAIALVAREFGRSTLILDAGKLAAGVGTWALKFITFKRWVYPAARPAGVGI
ncbi:MAG TPA: GtrA family protein [Actinomycetota bacterium]|nr:GtrA family protein [Actinomycetota bacterium]